MVRFVETQPLFFRGACTSPEPGRDSYGMSKLPNRQMSVRFCPVPSLSRDQVVGMGYRL